MSDSTTDFRSVQREFAAHMRDPLANPAPRGVEDRRLAIYRELLYNNVEGFMANSFPVLRSIVDDADWHAMIRHYFARHRARTPLFPKMPREFLHYLAEECGPQTGLPFMRELAHYELLELEASLDKREISDEPVVANLDCIDGCPVLNPIARMHAYRFPVHRIGPDYRPAVAPDEPTYLVVYRDRDDKVGFMQLNPITARLLELIAERTDRPGHSLLGQIAAELNHPDPAVVLCGGRDIMQELCERCVLLGARDSTGAHRATA